jgi:hypothetical protein
VGLSASQRLGSYEIVSPLGAGAARGVEALGDRIVDFSVARSGRIVAVREFDPGKPPLTIVRNWEQLLRGK